MAYAIYYAYHYTHQNSPGQLVYGRDMFLPVDRKINWEELITRKQQTICKNNDQENSNRIDHNFKKGDWATLVQPEAIKRTLAISHKRPYKVVKQHKNGSMRIQVSPYEIKKY